MDGSWKLMQPRNRGTAAAASASRRRPPATQGSGRTSRPGASSTDTQRRRTGRRSQNARSQRAADERARKAAAAQQTAVEVARAGREAHADALLRVEQAAPRTLPIFSLATARPAFDKRQNPSRFKSIPEVQSRPRCRMCLAALAS
jgi:hypothetical protein